MKYNQSFALKTNRKNAIIQVTEGTINAETEDDLMAAEAMAQKTDASEIKEAIVRIRTISTGSRKSNASGFFI